MSQMLTEIGEAPAAVARVITNRPAIAAGVAIRIIPMSCRKLLERFK